MLNGEDSALMLARYLVEDNDKDFVEFNDQNCQTITIVNSIFFKLLGKYKILSDDEEKRLKLEIIPVITH